MTARTRWLVSPRYDLTFFIGSSVLTWFFLALYHGLNALGWAPHTESVLLTYFIFTAVFDHPHIFQTFSRTHADPTEFERHRRSHTWGLVAFIAFGFVVAALDAFKYVIVAAAVFGSWHIMRQHWGLLKAYKALNRDFERIDRYLDTAVFWLGAAALYLYDYTDNPPQTVIYGDLTAPFPNAPPLLGQALLYAFVGCLVLYAARLGWRVRMGEPVNVPKLLLLTAALLTHGLVFFFTATPFLVAEALETTYHDVQYQGWVMHYQRHRFPTGDVVRRWLKRAFAYGAVVGTLEVVALVYDGLGVLFVPFGMIVLWHYWVDGKIWRMRSQTELRDAVLGEAQPA